MSLQNIHSSLPHIKRMSFVPVVPVLLKGNSYVYLILESEKTPNDRVFTTSTMSTEMIIEFICSMVLSTNYMLV